MPATMRPMQESRKAVAGSRFDEHFTGATSAALPDVWQFLFPRLVQPALPEATRKIGHAMEQVQQSRQEASDADGK